MSQHMSTRILYPIYHFLPCATTHIHRVMRFLNHLAQTDDYEITVLTCKNPNDISYDVNLIKKLDRRIRIVRTHAVLFGLHNKSRAVNSYLTAKHEQKKASVWREGLRTIYRFTLRPMFNLISVPDNCMGWLPFALARGKKLLNTHAFDIILTTGPPFSNFVLAAALRKKGLKLVIDYRDPWRKNYYMETHFSMAWQVNLSRKLEKYVLQKTDVVIANTESMRQFIIRENIECFKNRNVHTEVIYNGFDYSEARVDKEANQRLTFLFTGRFHGSYITPKYLLQAFRELIDSNRIDSDEIRMVFTGTLIPSDFEQFSHIKTDDFCEFRGMVPHAENLKLIRSADCLVVICSQNRVDRVLVPSKIYEYLHTANLILGLLPNGEAFNILQNAGGAILVTPDDVAEIKRALKEIYNRFQISRSLAINRDWQYIGENFDARKQAEKLQTILESLHRPSTTRSIS